MPIPWLDRATIRPAVPGRFADGEADPAVVAPCLDSDRSVRRARGRAVLHRILHQRLEDERRDERVLNVRIEVHRHVETVFESHRLQLQVPFDERQLLLEADFLMIDVIEGQPEQVAEPLDHQARRARLALDVRGDGVECVEEKMRLQLRPKDVQARLGEQAFELGRSDEAVLQVF